MDSTEYRTEVNTGSGGFGFTNLTFQDAVNDIMDYVTYRTLRRFKSWKRNHTNDKNAKFICENLECMTIKMVLCRQMQ